MPSWPWLSSGWLRGYFALSAPAIPLIRNSLDHPLMCHWLPGATCDRFFSLWEDRDLFLDALDQPGGLYWCWFCRDAKCRSENHPALCTPWPDQCGCTCPLCFVAHRLCFAVSPGCTWACAFAPAVWNTSRIRELADPDYQTLLRPVEPSFFPCSATTIFSS